MSKKKIQWSSWPSKDAWIMVLLQCTSCVQDGVAKELTGISRYITKKYQHNKPGPLELQKFCPYCYKNMIHGEIGKKKKKIKPRACVWPFQGTVKIIYYIICITYI